MPRIKPGPPCSVCGQPSHARNLCSVHHSRWLRHGHTEQTRPEGWGKRSSHSLKDTWCNTLKCVEGRDGRWNDFWAFVEDVGDRPHPDARLKRRGGIAVAEYDRLLEVQGGGCAVCGEADGTFGRLVVDHCHNSKRVRGL